MKRTQPSAYVPMSPDEFIGPARAVAHVRTAIVQDVAALEAMDPRRFTYQLADKRFIEYFISRTGMRIDRVEAGWAMVVNRLANYRVPAPDSAWKITRAKLQDCWEIYSRASRAAKA